MSIKSKKANEIIERGGRLEFTHLGCSIAQNAVIQAEFDARERAVRAFIETTSKHTFYTEEHIRTLPEFREFLKHYDQ